MVFSETIKAATYQLQSVGRDEAGDVLGFLFNLAWVTAAWRRKCSSRNDGELPHWDAEMDSRLGGRQSSAPKDISPSHGSTPSPYPDSYLPRRARHHLPNEGVSSRKAENLGLFVNGPRSAKSCAWHAGGAGNYNVDRSGHMRKSPLGAYSTGKGQCDTHLQRRSSPSAITVMGL